MYIKKLTIWFFILLSVVLAACSDITDVRGGDTPDVPPDGVVLTLKLPNFSKNTVATRATEQPKINSLCVLCYDANDKYLGMSTISNDSIKLNDDGTYKVRVKAVPRTATLHLVANADVTDNDAKDKSGMNNLYNATRSSNSLNLDTPVCWGKITVEDLLSPNTKVSLFRMFAKASVEKDPELTKFEITGFKLINTATEGTIATTLFTDVALPSSVHCTAETAYSMDAQPFYETPANKAFMIIKAKYDGGAETYYKVAFLNKNADGTSKPMALLRNHHYQVKVTAVNHAGCASEQEAINNLPDNRISVVVVDDNPQIVDMIACKDYELGVCAGPEVAGKVQEATITFVTTKPINSDNYNNLRVGSTDDWITVPQDYTSIDNLPTSTTSTTSTKGFSSEGRLYTMKLSLKQNYNSDARKGSVTITYGDLSLNVEIKQLGYDFRHDDNRKVQIRGLDGLSSDEEKDYFGWMDSKLNGIEPKYNQGKVRNDGLHFFVGNKTVDNKTVSYNTVYYLIPRLPNDEMKYDAKRVKVDDDFIEDGKTFYKVSLADNSPESNYNMWICSDALTISITNSVTKITVKYPVYHVGLFAKLTGKAAADYQLGKDKASGERKDSEWYYYEMVDVKAGDKTYHMLDRNLGATNNGYYSPSTTALKGNEGAIGGYFKISVADNISIDAKKNNDVVNALAIGNFKVCNNSCLQNLVDNDVLKIETMTTATGENYNCLRMNTESNSQIPQIFIPMSGYYEGRNNDDVLKDIHHANLWTSSRLSDYQGFSSSSPEYGFWYIYLDVFGKTLNLSNYRFVSGSLGKNTGRYIAMPVRLAAEKK